MKFAGQVDSGIGKEGGRGRGKRCHKSVEYREWLGVFFFFGYHWKGPLPINSICSK